MSYATVADIETERARAECAEAEARELKTRAHALRLRLHEIAELSSVERLGSWGEVWGLLDRIHAEASRE